MFKEQINAGTTVYNTEDFRPYCASPKMIKGSLANLFTSKMFIVLNAHIKNKIHQAIFDGSRILTNQDF